MKEKIKKIIFGYLPGFITGLIVCGTISVIAATYFPSNDVSYDNSTSGLSSTNVQGAIDELYGICFPKAGDTILDNTDIVISGDGLYEDEYEDGRYFYKGANPNNYVTFNNEQAGWRIISLEPDGTIKIMRTEDINTGNSIAWDSSNINNWSRPASLNTYLNGTYYNGLNSTAQSQIVAKDWSIGVVSANDNNMSNTINNEKATKWNGKVALVTVSEYIRSNSNKSSCGTVNQLWNAISEQCKGTTWMYNSNYYWWTLSPYSGASGTVLNIFDSSGYIFYDYANFTNRAVRPALYLSSEVKITGGDGSQSNPYTILSTGQF